MQSRPSQEQRGIQAPVSAFGRGDEDLLCPIAGHTSPPMQKPISPAPKRSAKPRRAASKRPPRVGFVSLGCPKALVDSERIITKLRAEGYELSADYAGADVVVVNT